MVIKRKEKKEESPTVTLEKSIGAIIQKGGRVASEVDIEITDPKQETRFTLRLPEILMKKIDEARKSRVGNVSRNQWIVETINKRLK